MKITPAHDPNDFEVASRHDLPIIRVLNDDGTVNEQGGKYAGLDRYEARKQIEQDLQKIGALVKVEDYAHNVGACYRCHTTVEPIVSKQWFVSMKELAKPAIEAVEKGDTQFVPERFTKIFYNWMYNIKDWCISRQLWWGHRIPAYYCEECGHMMVAKEQPEKCEKCGSTQFRQDEDVLDTWFSSAMWPYSTLGWPDQTPDMEKYFPNSVLVTGWDIIFFWVARMIFSSLFHTGKTPFKDVLIHGLVLDAQGRKMSKSLGNGIDPLEKIDSHGADSLRFMLVTGNTPGNNLRFRDERLDGARNFANKIWNASRFVLMNLEGYEDGAWNDEELSLHDRWILARLNETAEATRTNLDRYELGEAARGIYEFIWDDFCDWYVELSKNALYKGTDKERLHTQRVLVYVLRNALELLHPFMPFITEEIWQKLPHDGDTIVLAAYPEYKEAYADDAASADMGMMIEMIKAIRNLRAEMKVPLGQKAKLILAAAEREKDIIAENAGYLDKMAAVDEVDFIALSDDAPKGAAAAILGDIRIYMPLAGLIDMDKEKARLAKEMEKTEKEIARLEGKLGNQGFLAKAPAEVVEGEKAKLDAAQKKLDGFKETLAILEEV